MLDGRPLGGGCRRGFRRVERDGRVAADLLRGARAGGAAGLRAPGRMPGRGVRECCGARPGRRLLSAAASYS